ncbi:hypothetical protein [Actinacidiphila acidipaludis]|uniref:Guanylate cyclase domain-containing protein n=1 Tax=Actinacidiphila acidipaludis TaxID=2873382 RepID=A0ABS7QHF2_9ACTN|nr:hypothetical protein [Streptomyces acidipaludis]MBY8881357.1 hypothetical protein [Streptomyces acidipaludis]
MTGEALHHWIVVLDLETFSTRSDPLQLSLRAAMYDVVRTAFGDAGVNAENVVMEDRGDGILMLVPSTVSPVRLAGPLLRALDDGLRAKAAIYGDAHSLRMRVALHQGLAVQDPHGWSGDAVNTAFRLVDAQPLRDVLKAATLARLAFVVSEQVYEGVVRHGHRGLDPAAYLPLQFRTKHGETIHGWVTVPGYSAPPGLPSGDGSPQRPCTAPGAPGTTPAGTGAAPAEPAGSAAGTSAAGAQPGRVTTFSVGTVLGDVVGGDKHVHGGPIS